MEKFNKRGFTLIELLAVIVILAVIALIATPIIMNVINDSKRGAAKDAMYGYVKAVELASTKLVTVATDAPSGSYTVTNGNLVMGNETLVINFKGNKPKDGGIAILSNGQVIEAILKFDGIDVEYKNGKAEEYKPKRYTVGEEVYFDPTGTVAECKSGKEWTATNTATSCYKWNVIKDNGFNIEMLLDHNLGNQLPWISKTDYVASGGTEEEYGTRGNNKYGPITLVKQLKADTANWSEVETLRTSDNVMRDVDNGMKYTISYNGMKARLISGQEVADIGQDAVWEPNKYTGKVYSEVPWLYQNLSSSNTITQPYGYWTDTAYTTNRITDAWRLAATNPLGSYDVHYANSDGVRPVVRVLKSNI